MSLPRSQMKHPGRRPLLKLKPSSRPTITRLPKPANSGTTTMPAAGCWPTARPSITGHPSPTNGSSARDQPKAKPGKPPPRKTFTPTTKKITMNHFKKILVFLQNLFRWRKAHKACTCHLADKTHCRASSCKRPFRSAEGWELVHDFDSPHHQSPRS